MHLLFGDEPYLYTDLIRRRRRSSHGNWHKRWCRKLSELQGDERVLVFCGLRRVTETWHSMQLGNNTTDLAVTRRRDLAKCSACIAYFERLLELERAGVRLTRRADGERKGESVHLLFKPSSLQVTAVINRTDPREWDWSQVVPLEKGKREPKVHRLIDCACPTPNPIRCSQLQFDGEGPVPVDEPCSCACHAGTQVELPHLSVPRGTRSSAARGAVIGRH